MKRLMFGIGALALILLVAAGAVLAIGGPLGPFMHRIGPEVEKATGMQVHFDGSARLVVWPELALIADDVRVAEAGKPEDFARIDRVRVGLSYASLSERRAIVTDVSLRRPAFTLVEGQTATARPPASPSSSPTSSAEIGTGALQRVTVEDGSFIYRIPRERFETRVESIQLTAQPNLPGGAMKIVGQGRWDGEPVNLTADLEQSSANGQASPFNAVMNFSSRAITVSGRSLVEKRTLKLENLSGRSGPDRFSGSLFADWSRARPYVKASMGFDRLEWRMPSEGGSAAPAARAGPAAGTEAWSDKPVSLTSLRLFDADIIVATNELSVQGVRAKSAQVEAELRSGILNIAMPPADLHGGKVQGRLMVDASRPTPSHSVQLSVSGVQALPLLSEAVPFTRLEGKIQTRVNLTAQGDNSRAILSSLGGTAEMFVEDGAVRGVDIAKLIRSVSKNILSGWQEQNPETDKTPFSVFGATFQINAGRVATDNLRLVSNNVRVSGKGTIDLPTRTLDFRTEPRLVVTLSTQTRAEPVDFGVPVIIKGQWDSPQIYPDVAGILQNPEAAYGKLRELGTGLFGLLGSGEGASGSSTPGGSASGSSAPKGMNDLMQSMDKLFSPPPSSGAGGTQGQPPQQGGLGGLLQDLLKR